jgi:hypothetical protein
MSSRSKPQRAKILDRPLPRIRRSEAPRAVVLNDWLVASRKALLTWLPSWKESHKENGVPLHRLRTVVPLVS